MCKVINILNHDTPLTQENYVYIGYPESGSPMKWGNQFDVAGELYLKARDTLGQGHTLDIDHAVELYRHWLLHSPEGLRLQEDIDELRGKVLGCFCKPHPCHGDVLIELLGQREEIPDVL